MKNKIINQKVLIRKESGLFLTLLQIAAGGQDRFRML